MSFIQNDNNDGGNRQGRNSSNSAGAQDQPDQTGKEGVREERQDSQQHRQEQGQELSEDSVTSELTAVHRYPFLPLGTSGSATITTTTTTMITTTTVSIDAAVEATTTSLGDEKCYVESEVDTATAGETTKAKRPAVAVAAVVDKPHAAAFASLPSISSSNDDMTAVAINDDTARSRSTVDEKGISAQPSSISSSTSISLLCRTFKRNPHSQNTTTLEQQEQQAVPTASSPLPPCSSPPSSPSTSTSSTFVEGSLDEVLLTALQNRQDRLFLLKLEGEYCNFIQDPSKDVLEFPWLNSYFRMMIHRSAIYYRLARTVNAAQKKIILSKTEHTSIPVLRFQELVEEEEDVPVKSFKVLRRSPPRPVSACEARGSTVTATTIPGVASSAPTQSSPWQEPGRQLTGSGNDRRGAGATLEQREAAYAKARARIFDTEDKNEEEKNREEHEQPCQDASSTPKGEPRRSPSVTSGTSSPTVRTITSTVDSLSKLDLSQGHGHNKAKSDITRRTSTSSTISSSSSSSGATMADISARTDFVGSWMMGSGGHSMPHPPSGIYDHRSVARNNASYCECGADHGSVGHDIATGAQYNTPSRRASCACHNHRQQPQESHHHQHPVVCSCQNSHGSSQQSSSSMRLTSSVHGGYPAASALPRHQQQQRQQQLQQQRLFSPCNQQHYPQQYQHHPHQHPHPHPHPSHQHQHQHYPGYQHPIQYGHAHVCARLDPQAQHQHQGHQQHRQPHYTQQYQTHHHQLSHQSHCFIPHHASSHNHHQHNRGAGSSNSGLQDPRWLDCIPRPEMQPSHYNAPPANSVSGMIIESNPAPIQDVPPPHPELFQVSVRPYPSSNGYRPCRQGISLPQQMTRQTQQRQHRHPPGQVQTQGQQDQGQNHDEQRQHQQRQQSSAPNTRQQQQHHQQQKLSVGSIDHPHSPAPTSSSSSSSSTSYSSSTKRHSHGGGEGRKEVRGASHTRHHNHRQQEQHHQQQGTIKSREDSLHVPFTVYDVERRPPKSTELYDPYAATNTPACGSGSKSRDRHKH